MKTKVCKKCKETIHANAKKCPYCGSKQGLSKLLIIISTIFIIGLVAGLGGSEKGNNPDVKKSDVIVEVVDFSHMDQNAFDTWCKEKNINGIVEREYSDTVEYGKYISQSIKSGETIYEGDQVKLVLSLGKEPTTEQKNALEKAQSYYDLMNMSKQGIYDQLTSEYGEAFNQEDAQYAIDHLDVDYDAAALKSAKSYFETMNMSKQSIFDQLISEYGDQFTQEEAQYAIDHLDVDYKEAALKSAKSYYETMNMSKNKIYDQLTSEYGEKFTKEEAQYAIDHLE